MSIVYNTNVINNRLQQVINAIDAGSGNGILNIGGSSNLSPILVAITLSKPCATISSGVLTFSGLTLSAVAGLTGTAASANITDSTGTVVASGLTVGVSSSFDVQVSQTSFVGGDVISLTAATITGN